MKFKGQIAAICVGSPGNTSTTGKEGSAIHTVCTYRYFPCLSMPGSKAVQVYTHTHTHTHTHTDTHTNTHTCTGGSFFPSACMRSRGKAVEQGCENGVFGAEECLSLKMEPPTSRHRSNPCVVLLGVKQEV